MSGKQVEFRFEARLNWFMPDKNGIVTLKELRALRATKEEELLVVLSNGVFVACCTNQTDAECIAARYPKGQIVEAGTIDQNSAAASGETRAR